MNNTIINQSIKWLSFLLSIYSVYILLRGHNSPGGGFIGGLLLSLSSLLLFISHRLKFIEKIVKNYFPQIIGWLFLVLFLVAVLPLLFSKSFLQGLWTTIPVPIAGKFSSVLVFDIIIYFIVYVSVVYSYLSLKDYKSSGDHRA